MWLGHSSGMWTRLTGVLAAVTVQHADAKDSPGFGGVLPSTRKVIQLFRCQKCTEAIGLFIMLVAETF